MFESVYVCLFGSLSLEFGFELFGQTHIGSEGCIDCLFLEAWHPVIELVEAITEADTFLVVKKGKIVLIGTLCKALLVKLL